MVEFGVGGVGGQELVELSARGCHGLCVVVGDERVDDLGPVAAFAHVEVPALVKPGTEELVQFGIVGAGVYGLALGYEVKTSVLSAGTAITAPSSDLITWYCNCVRAAATLYGRFVTPGLERDLITYSAEVTVNPVAAAKSPQEAAISEAAIAWPGM